MPLGTGNTARTQSIIDSQGGGSTSRDLAAMTDSAKRVAETQAAAMNANTQQNLNVATGKNQGQMTALVDKIGTHVAKTAGVDSDADPEKYLKTLTARIKTLTDLADEAKNTTGNQSAANTYMQVVNILTQRLNTFQTTYAKQLAERVQAGATGGK